jgi:hypothetical protein
MKKTIIATLMAGTMVLGMTACGTKPAKTTVSPTTTTTVEETTVETTDETTPTETTTAETTPTQPEFPAVSFSGGTDLITNIQATNITYEEVDMGEYYGDPSLAGMTAPVYRAQANQDIVITFMSNEALALLTVNTAQNNKVKDGCTLTKDGNIYTLTIPANTFSAGDICFIMIKTEDYEENADGTLRSGNMITTNFEIV